MASHYNLLEYDSDEEARRYPEIPLSNLASAAFFIAEVLDKNGIVYGLMGGLAVTFLGGERETRDVDIAFQAPGKMRDLWCAVEAEPRLIIPDKKLISNIMKVFALTGPGYDDCGERIPVEVDLIENGFQNSPRDLASHRRELVVMTKAGPRSIYTIDILHLLRGKMTAFMSRGAPNDKYDIQHLLVTFPNDIQSFKDHLDPESVDHFIDTVSTATRDRWKRFFGR